MRDKKIALLKKILYPEEYETTFVFTYFAFNDELKQLIGRSGYVKEFKMKYRKSLRFLEQLKKKCVMQKKLFELLVGSDGIYSMRLTGEKNIRILFDFQVVCGKEVAVLYNCFQEKRTEDYKDGIQIAQERRKELFGGDEKSE